MAAAVPGMVPEDVAVIDAVAGLLPGDESGQRPDAVGDARAAELRRNVERLLEARVGPGKAVVEVAVDVVTDAESITQRTFDPQGRVAISTDNTTTTGTNTQGGAATLGATGAMILGTLIDELHRRQLRFGLATLCVGGGMGIATIVERI